MESSMVSAEIGGVIVVQDAWDRSPLLTYEEI
jgi:hypothetical protein